MKRTVFLLIAAACTLPAVAQEAQRKPLALDGLPKICQDYFRRAQTCYAKVDAKTAQFYKDNTKFLMQTMPGASVGQRETMCKMAMDGFAAKAKQLKCE